MPCVGSGHREQSRVLGAAWGPSVGSAVDVTPGTGISSGPTTGTSFGNQLWNHLCVSRQPWGTERNRGLRAGTSVGHGTEREDTPWGCPWGLAIGCGMWIHSAGSPMPVGLWDRNIAPLGARSIAMGSPPVWVPPTCCQDSCFCPPLPFTFPKNPLPVTCQHHSPWPLCRLPPTPILSIAQFPFQMLNVIAGLLITPGTVPSHGSATAMNTRRRPQSHCVSLLVVLHCDPSSPCAVVGWWGHS